MDTQNIIGETIAPHNFDDFEARMKRDIDSYIAKKINSPNPPTYVDYDDIIDKATETEKEKLKKADEKIGDSIPQIAKIRKKNHDDMVADGKSAERDLPIIQRLIKTLEEQLKRLPATADIDKPPIYLRPWLPWAILAIVISVDASVLYGQFVDMRFSFFNAIMATLGILLAVDLLVPLSTLLLMRSYVEKSRVWIIGILCLILAAFMVFMTFNSVADMNTNVRENLSVQIQQAQENGNIDGNLAALTKAYEELPTNMQILAKGLIPAVTTLVSVVVFLLNTPYALAREKRKALEKNRIKEKELEVKKKMGEDAALKNFDYAAEENELHTQRERFYVNALGELDTIAVELKEYFRMTLNSTM